MILANN